MRRLVALHAPTVDVLFELLLEDACRGLALGMVRPQQYIHIITERNHTASNFGGAACADACALLQGTPMKKHVRSSC